MRYDFLIRVKQIKYAQKRAKGMRKDGERMKKPWMKRLAAVSLILAVGSGAGTLLRAHEEGMAGKSGGGDL